MMKRQLWIPFFLAAILITIGQVELAIAQDKTLFWQRYDVTLDVQQNSDMLVEEVQQIAFTGGTFRFGFAAIPLDRVERITDVQVSEIINGSERSYTPNSSGDYGFTTAVNEGNLEITWHFPPTSNSEHTYILRYRVIGGLRFYDGGDQVWWKAIPPDHNFPIREATVTVNFPATFRKDELKVDAYGAPVDDASYTDRGSVVFTAQDIPAGEELEVRVQFPHGVVQGSPPAWQSAFDLRQQWGPVVTVLAGALGLILMIGGPVGVYVLWFTYGRDTGTAQVPDYITEPPGSLPAAIVGTLIDEQVDTKDIIAGILDLARRGAIRMEEQQKDSKWGFGVSREFVFHLEDESKAEYPHERELIKHIFGAGSEKKLRDLRQKFYTAIPELEKLLYTEVVNQGYFPRNPKIIRDGWRSGAILGIIVSAIATFCAIMFLIDYSAAVICPGLGLIVSMLALLIVSRHMPRKTDLGAEEAAKWLAFKRYLENIEEYSDLEAVKDKFEQYLPYAMAFGLERRLIHKFSKIDTPAPSWWGPVMPYGHYPPFYGTGGHVSSSGGGVSGGGPPGPLAGEGGMPSLSGMSESIGTSLSSMSTGLGSLLSSASSTLTSTPPSSSSRGGGFGGGGWSGGGSFGGGGGGGGSRGFG